MIFPRSSVTVPIRMARFFLPLLFALPLLSLPSLSSAASTAVCPSVQLDQAENLDIRFTAAEVRLLCGDPNSYAWQKISPLQARYFAQSFLQTRGYLNPQFEIKGGILTIRAGPVTRLKRIQVVRAPEGLFVDRKRKVLNRPLTPDLLTEIEKWAKKESQELGFACAKVRVTASPETGVASLDVDSGPRYRFGHIENSGLVTKPGLVDRYLAFLPGQVFDPRLLQLSSQRLLAQELYVSSYFDVQCPRSGENNEFSIQRHLIAATPRLMTFGVGVDSEVGPLLRSTYRHTQLTESGGQGQIVISASYREQKLDGQLNLFPLQDLRSRFQWIPRLQVKREREEQFEALTTMVGISPAYGFETENAEHSFAWGPALEEVRLIAGDGPERTSAVTLNWSSTSKSHLFEYYAADPREGWLASTNINTRLRGISTSSTTHRLQFDLQFLWNFRDYDPPLMVFGSRTRLGSFVLESEGLGLSEVPISQRFFLGGDGDLRGFSRKSIPFDQQGFNSVLSQGFEIRWVEVLPWSLQPLVLFDLGWGSDRSFSLSRETYAAPGVGLRWNSPLGPVRTTLAQGMVLNAEDESTPTAHWQWFVSFGREF